MALKAKQEAQRRERGAAAKRRAVEEEHERQSRLRTGIAGQWDRLRGERKRQLDCNRLEAEAAQERDQTERRQFTAAQLAQRREVVIERVRQRHTNTAVTRDTERGCEGFPPDGDSRRGRTRRPARSH